MVSTTQKKPFQALIDSGPNFRGLVDQNGLKNNGLSATLPVKPTRHVASQRGQRHILHAVAILRTDTLPQCVATAAAPYFHLYHYFQGSSQE